MDNEHSALLIIFTEFYYWVTVVLMFLIHVGFCLYEVGVSREKNKLNTLMKNSMLIPTITIAFFLGGWWLYFAVQNGPWITGPIKSAAWSEPWNELMGPHLGGAPTNDRLTVDDTELWSRLNGVFWAAFLLFSWTAGSILSGAVIERIRSAAFWLLAVLVGSVTWVIVAAWGWSDSGWMVKILGYHDAYASGVIHAIAGGSALAILIHLGPRIGRFENGRPQTFPAHNTWMIIIGMFLIFTGFWGFYAACNVPMTDIDPSEDRVFYSATTIYLTPTTLSAITFNFLMALAGGLLMGYFVSKGDPFWTFQGGLGGIITASAGNDLYHPVQAMLLAGFGVWCGYKLHYWVERKFRIDDAVGAVAIHGYCGSIGVIAAGFLLWGYPSSPQEGFAPITPWGQFIGAVIVFLLMGFLPCYIAAGILKRLGVLRIPLEVELAGLDHEILQQERADREKLESVEAQAWKTSSSVKS